uniref:Uncharacterized protein n=1 Tax=Knipowitschia caucasica TaxID=637954 RepID=A0AAV2L6Y8_KNICA
MCAQNPPTGLVEARIETFQTLDSAVFPGRPTLSTTQWSADNAGRGTYLWNTSVGRLSSLDRPGPALIHRQPSLSSQNDRIAVFKRELGPSPAPNSEKTMLESELERWRLERWRLERWRLERWRLDR